MKNIRLIPAAVATLLLIWATFDPAAGSAFYSGWHYLAHFAAFVLLAFLWATALPSVRAIYVTLAVIAFAQEGIEIFTHVHAFEIPDAFVDSLGAALGAVGARNWAAEQETKPG